MAAYGSDSSEQHRVVSRRTALTTTAAVGLATLGVSPAAAQSSGGDTDWEYDTGAEVHASPTIVGSA